MQFVDQKVHEMKNKIINRLLPLEKENVISKTTTTSNNFEVPRSNDALAWPSLQSSNRGKTYASVVVKSDKNKKLETSEVRLMESKVNQMLSTENIEATIISSTSTRNGDFMIKFNEKDDVNTIAKKMEDNLGFKAQSRPILLPKMTISYVLKYISLGDSLTELIVKSNKWLQDMVTMDNESFEVLFTYEVKDWGSIVCRMSPKIRAEMIHHGNKIKIENRLCPVKDRFHVLQCGNCLGFGHRMKVCRMETVTCTHCAKDHKWRDCPHKEQENEMRCSNCQEASETGGPSNESSIKHDARSQQCPIYQRQLQKQIERTSWGPGPIPTI